MIYKRYFRYFDWISFFVMLFILGIGLLFVFSSTYRPNKIFSIFFKKQLLGVFGGILIYLFFSLKDLRNFTSTSYYIYFCVLLLLAYTVFGGQIGMGACRWISLYFFRFQPSELVKIFFPAFVAVYFGEQNSLKYFQVTQIPFVDFLCPLTILLVNFILIMKQPDLGTAIITLFSGLILFWFIGINKKFFIILGLIISLGAPVFWKTLLPYQKQRILVFLGYGSSKKERYQIEQSKIAIGSGKLFGRGLLKGMQNKLEFLPEDHTDFIFSVVCEEWGLIGAFLVLFLFACLMIRLLIVTTQVSSFFNQIIALGLISPILLSICVNIGMVIGILPIVGIPLPLFSYGISNLWITMLSLGWLNNIVIRRFYVG
jgi:rod shape determining protein RodA